MSIQVSFDPLGALYVRFSDARIVRTIEVVPDSLVLDLDDRGQVVGIEALEPGMLRLVVDRMPPPLKLPEEAKRVDFVKLGQSFLSAAALL